MNFLSPVLRAFVFLLPLQLLNYLIPAPSEFRFPGQTLNMKRFVSQGWTLHARCCAVLRAGQALQYRALWAHTARLNSWTLQQHQLPYKTKQVKQTTPTQTVAPFYCSWGFTVILSNSSPGCLGRSSCPGLPFPPPARAATSPCVAEVGQGTAVSCWQPTRKAKAVLAARLICEELHKQQHRGAQAAGEPGSPASSRARGGCWGLDSALGEKQAQKRAPEVPNHHCFSNHLCISEQNLCQL